MQKTNSQFNENEFRTFIMDCFEGRFSELIATFKDAGEMIEPGDEPDRLLEIYLRIRNNPSKNTEYEERTFYMNDAESTDDANMRQTKLDDVIEDLEALMADEPTPLGCTTPAPNNVPEAVNAGTSAFSVSDDVQQDAEAINRILQQLQECFVQINELALGMQKSRARDSADSLKQKYESAVCTFQSRNAQLKEYCEKYPDLYLLCEIYKYGTIMTYKDFWVRVSANNTVKYSDAVQRYLSFWEALSRTGYSIEFFGTQDTSYTHD